MSNFKHFILFILLGVACFPVYTQEINGVITRAKIIGRDTVPILELPKVVIVGEKIFESRREERRHSRLVRNVKVVYPYAKLAGIKYRKYSQKLGQIESKSERRHMMKQIEEEIRHQFEDDLRRLNFSQGLILIKLIDRETRHTSYDIVKDFRGMFQAVFWQSLGRLFGYDLRTKYDPLGEDKDIEQIVMLIELGVI